jgi:hypothetical protein
MGLHSKILNARQWALSTQSFAPWPTKAETFDRSVSNGVRL